jgi:Arc/MetJ-type ribon-helix-helix transcriptional regulator
VPEEKKTKAVSLPAELYSRIEERARTTGFSSADDYVIFVLEEVVKEEGEAISREEEAELKRRLRALGYQD